MRKKIVAGNWKMNKLFVDAEELLYEITEFLDSSPSEKIEVIVCPPAVFLELATDIAQESTFWVGAQNMSNHEKGAFTGEISAAMLNSLDVDYCIIGHSERRMHFGESNEILAEKVIEALKNEVIPIYCCGELLKEREAGNHFDIVREQLNKGVFHLNKDNFADIIIAYEPVWAIGTGVTASPEQAQEMHAFIRSIILEKYGKGCC